MAPGGHFDVIIVGAGLAGIGTACRLKMADPKRTYAVLESRSTLGGTWDLFRFPGVRSDSDMETLGFPFRPWRGARSLASGEEILGYLSDTARAFGIDEHIRYGHRVTAVDWSRDRASWTVHVAADGREHVLSCNFLIASTGYFDYEQAHAPVWPRQESFTGTIVHPQFWPDGLDFADKRIVVIGSGATAITIVPALAEKAAHVTMLQRSPSYVVAWPRHDRFGRRVRRILPGKAADWLIRSKNISLSSLSYAFARRRPDAVRRVIRAGVTRQLGSGYEVDRHFEPRYAPWDQRLCLAADGDLFAALRSGKASVVTDEIAHFTPEGLVLASGERLAADLVVTATGLSIKLFGGLALTVDRRPVDVAERLIYRGTMIEGVPNFAFSFGYATTSWTLKSDLTARFVARLLRRMAQTGRAIVTPRAADPGTPREPFLDIDSGYVRRAMGRLPHRGPAPWRSASNYLLDVRTMLGRRLEDGVLQFEKRAISEPEPVR